MLEKLLNRKTENNKIEINDFKKQLKFWNLYERLISVVFTRLKIISLNALQLTRHLQCSYSYYLTRPGFKQIVQIVEEGNGLYQKIIINIIIIFIIIIIIIIIIIKYAAY